MRRVGIIANPVSARDIFRVIANATALQITHRAVVSACGDIPIAGIHRHRQCISPELERSGY